MYKKKKKNVKKFHKRFNTRLIRAKHSYSIEDITQCLNIHKNTVGDWLKAGLKKIDGLQPYLIWGQDLIDFLDARNKDKKRPCAENQLFCCRCQIPTYAKDNMVRIHHSDKRTNLSGICATCGSSTNRTISPQAIGNFKKVFVIEGLEQKNLIECGNSSAIATK
jgi:hypothetical protein